MDEVASIEDILLGILLGTSVGIVFVTMLLLWLRSGRR